MVRKRAVEALGISERWDYEAAFEGSELCLFRSMMIAGPRSRRSIGMTRR